MNRVSIRYKMALAKTKSVDLAVVQAKHPKTLSFWKAFNVDINDSYVECCVYNYDSEISKEVLAIYCTKHGITDELSIPKYVPVQFLKQYGTEDNMCWFFEDDDCSVAMGFSQKHAIKRYSQLAFSIDDLIAKIA